MKSIRYRLLFGLLTAITLLGLIVAIQIYRDALHEVEEVFDAHLAQYARVLSVLIAKAVEDEDPQALQRFLPFMPEVFGVAAEDGDEAQPYGHEYERKLAFEIWTAEGELLLHSIGAPVFLDAPQQPGYSEQASGNHIWRVFNLIEPYRRVRVRVAERDDVRTEMAIKIVRRQLAPGLLSLPLLGIVIWLVIGRGLSPLQSVTQEIARRSPDQLEAVPIADVPNEIRPLVAALNHLFARLSAAFERERRFTADAAHELRTPLAAIKTQAQVALEISDERARRHALQQVIRGVDRSGRLAEQLFTLTRLDPEACDGLSKQQLNLHAVAREIAATTVPTALKNHIELTLDGADSAIVLGDPCSLAILMRNLIDNAVRYTPAQGSVQVLIELTDGAVRLRVIDTGPGIPVEQRRRVFERFYRGLGHNIPGSGLGLSIVQRIAELHGAEVELLDGPGGRGLEARVDFPAPATSGDRPLSVAANVMATSTPNVVSNPMLPPGQPSRE